MFFDFGKRREIADSNSSDSCLLVREIITQEAKRTNERTSRGGELMKCGLSTLLVLFILVIVQTPRERNQDMLRSASSWARRASW